MSHRVKQKYSQKTKNVYLQLMSHISICVAHFSNPYLKFKCSCFLLLLIKLVHQCFATYYLAVILRYLASLSTILQFDSSNKQLQFHISKYCLVIFLFLKSLHNIQLSGKSARSKNKKWFEYLKFYNSCSFGCINKENAFRQVRAVRGWYFLFCF